MQVEKKVAYQDVPAAVREAFEQQFAGAKILGASAETAAGEVVFEVECEWRGRHHDVTFRADGGLVSVEEAIPMSEVPAAVAAALRKEFPKARVMRAEKIREGGTVSYEFQLSGGVKKEAKFSAEGKLLSSE
ncbi:MAG: PepSY-like domain-containing protein [Bryobacteraceae bacterium]